MLYTRYVSKIYVCCVYSKENRLLTVAEREALPRRWRVFRFPFRSTLPTLPNGLLLLPASRIFLGRGVPVLACYRSNGSIAVGITAPIAVRITAPEREKTQSGKKTVRTNSLRWNRDEEIGYI